MKRYNYYRCSSVTKRDWEACSTKQVSAERLEQYIVENLGRIAVDKEYVESFVFRLKNESIGGQAGLELSPSQSQLTPEMVTQTLQSFISKVKTETGQSSNLLAKRTIQKINYSPQTIKISFVTEPNSIDFVQNSSSALHAENWVNVLPNETKKATTVPVRELVMADSAPLAGRVQNCRMEKPIKWN